MLTALRQFFLLVALLCVARAQSKPDSAAPISPKAPVATVLKESELRRMGLPATLAEAQPLSTELAAARAEQSRSSDIVSRKMAGKNAEDKNKIWSAYLAEGRDRVMRIRELEQKLLEVTKPEAEKARALSAKK